MRSMKSVFRNSVLACTLVATAAVSPSVAGADEDNFYSQYLSDRERTAIVYGAMTQDDIDQCWRDNEDHYYTMQYRGYDYPCPGSPISEVEEYHAKRHLDELNNPPRYGSARYFIALFASMGLPEWMYLPLFGY